MITLKDIAREAGVSVMTVSRVINGNQSKVSEETTQKVLAIIKKSGYVPNSSARSLSSKNSRIVSIIMRGEGSSLKDSYNSIMLGNITQYAQQHGYYVMLHFIDDYHDITRRLNTWNVDGAIFLGTFDNDMLQIQETNQIPLVFIDSYSPVRQVINVGIDDYKGGVLAAKYFIEHGHRDLAFLSFNIKSSGVCKHRLEGFKDTIENAGLTLKPEHILETDDNTHLAEKILNFKEPVTAIFTTSDMLAIRLINEMTDRNIKVPEDYSVIGFDDLPFCRYITPKLTTISQDIDRKAELASNILFRHINNHDLPTESTVLDVQLVERNSVKSI
ncbi:LacI family DNA-binding transcriptional regulator [Clostridium oryzae]|uniref:HTH-type transcriptional repressor CytR n=1 Tax=Clostridium oryzae TaxID=1450648 RepID=A0A1V4IMW1_9CLOT|nr:LacI family DNA-binding transcriptional regulator [Clostridium oryzae]OPJ61179.1 HTH-type transcriptional repressor CytR [Clostridium oryzae]